MARLITPRTKRERRIGEKIWSHGEKAFSRRSYPPGQHGPKGSSRQSEYGIRLREKQKAQLTYGLLERQFRSYVERAKRRTGDTGVTLLEMLERRLDNAVYRAGLAPSREAARQAVRHGHIAVNGRRVDIPSFMTKIGQVISIHPNRVERKLFSDLKKSLENYQAPSWLNVDKNALSATVLALPDPSESVANINTQLIVEFYSR